MLKTENTKSTESERRPYDPPAVIEGAEFETLALSCGKTPGDTACDYIGNLSES